MNGINIFQSLSELVKLFGLDTAIAVVAFGFMVIMVWNYFNYIKGQTAKEHKSQEEGYRACQNVNSKEHEEIIDILDKMSVNIFEINTSFKTAINILIKKELNGNEDNGPTKNKKDKGQSTSDIDSNEGNE
jgi:hypothetical protein